MGLLGVARISVMVVTDEFGLHLTLRRAERASLPVWTTRTETGQQRQRTMRCKSAARWTSSRGLSHTCRSDSRCEYRVCLSQRPGLCLSRSSTKNAQNADDKING